MEEQELPRVEATPRVFTITLSEEEARSLYILIGEQTKGDMIRMGCPVGLARLHLVLDAHFSPE